MSFSFQITDYEKFIPATSKPHQHSCAFEPGTGHIWIAFIDRDGEGVIHRKFYRSTDDATFTEMADWQIGSPGDELDSFDPPELSFVIDPDGRYLYAVTDTKESAGGGLYDDQLWYARLYLYNIGAGFETEVSIDSHLGNDTTARIFQNYDIILDHRAPRTEKPIIAATKYNRPTEVKQGKLYWYGASGSLVITEIATAGVYLDADLSLADDRNNGAWYLHGSCGSTSYGYKGLFQGNGAPFVWSGDFDGVEINLRGADMALGENLVGLLTSGAPILKFATFDGETVSAIEEITGAGQSINSSAWSICYRYGYWHCLFGSDDELKYLARSPQGTWSSGVGTIQCGAGEWIYIGISNHPNVYPRDEYEFGCVMVKGGGATFPVVYQHIDDWYDAPVLPTGNYWEYGDLLGSKLIGVDVETEAVTELSGNSRLRIIDTVELEGNVLFSDQLKIMEFKEDFYKEYLDDFEPGYTNREFIIELPPRRRLGNVWKKCTEVQCEYSLGGLGSQTAYFDIVNEDGEQVTVDLDGTNSGVPTDIILWGRQHNAQIRDDTEYSFKVNYARIDGIYDGNKV